MVTDEESFNAALADLAAFKERHVTKTLNWYKNHARTPMLLFRTSGVFIIVVSVSLPLLSVLEGVWQETVLPVMALGIAGLTGLNTFFQWQTSWQSYRQTQYALEFLIAEWELRFMEARNTQDRSQGLAMAIQATDKLLQDARQLSSTETGTYFERVRLPETSRTK